VSERTTDTFFRRQLEVAQAKAGYRFSIDAVLLAHYIRPQADDVIVDLGTGCGIIPLVLAFRHPGLRLYGVEVQPELAELARLNVAANHFTDRTTILEQDMKEIRPADVGSPIDWVISNPPFRSVGSGRMNPNQQRAIARHEIKASLEDVIGSADRLLSLGGRFATIYSSERLVDMTGRMRAAGLEPKQMRLIHSKESREAKLFLMLGIKGANAGLTVEAPLIVYNEDGTYTAEVARMLE
jgi:tRNA1Val (adenine37-N6)-methyltransferase